MSDQFFQPVPSRPFQEVWTYAGFWMRVVAHLVDSILVWVGLMLLGAIISPSVSITIFDKQPGGGGGDYSVSYIQPADYMIMSNTPHIHWHGHGVLEMAWLVLPALYYILFESSRLQATPGKLLCRMRVTDLHGNRIDALRATGRYLGKYLSLLIFGIGFLMVAWTRRKQGLHDILAGTFVIRRELEAEAPPFPPA